MHSVGGGDIIKVNICKSIDIEATVHIDVDDIAVALGEYCEDLDAQFSDASIALPLQKKRSIGNFANAVVQCLQAASGPMIDMVDLAIRIKIAGILSNEANRWDPQGAEKYATICHKLAQYELVRSALIGMIGSDDLVELHGLAEEMRSHPASEECTRHIGAAIHALIHTNPVPATDCPPVVNESTSDALLRASAIAVLEWYYRDGSVGGAVDPMERLRAVAGVTKEWLCRD